MSNLIYYTQATVDDLRASAHSHLKWYYEGSGVHPLQRRVNTLSAGITVATLKGKLSSGVTDDAQNARAVFDAMPTLTRHQASDERLWTYLCHTDCADYVRRRWLRSEVNPKKRVTRVRSHFFADSTDTRSVFRDNGISRLWWMGRLARELKTATGADEDLFLEMLLHRQDVRSAILERPFVSRNLRNLTALYDVMHEHWNTEGRPLFERNSFRDWMKALNRRGGVLLLDALSAKDLRAVAEDEAQKVLEVGTSG